MTLEKNQIARLQTLTQGVREVTYYAVKVVILIVFAHLLMALV